MKSENPFASLSLERLFHEPSRMAIVSALAAAGDPVTFNDLKAELGMTDGNLSRHLKSLEEARAVTIKKSFVGAKPQTSVALSARGRDSFVQYLQTLEEVLKKAEASLKPAKKAAPIPRGKPARA
ncbi:MAG: transcriptional regulator [Verrucomicrobiae bacterium]|nr:transcriptional regulator [Verrucomicrobiae bacterium]